MAKAKFINVVSGKGGTGKTLLCTVLAELLGNQSKEVLVVDMDIFVRGLTALLYFHREENIILSSEREKTVSDIFHDDHTQEFVELSIQRIRSFYVVPAVSRIDQMFNFEKDLIFDLEHNHRSFKKVLKSIPSNKFDYIIFDCRAGYDNLVSVVHQYCDFTVCVQEEDDISEVTANNLIRQLEQDFPQKNILKLVNKARNIRNFEELEKKQRIGISFLGYIPFDMDVMNSFGEKSFWDDISRSLYKAAVSEAWNKLAVKTGLPDKLHFHRQSPVLSPSIEMSFGALPSRFRITAMLGIILIVFGALYFTLDSKVVYELRAHPDKLFSLVITAFGIGLVLFSFLKRNR